MKRYIGIDIGGTKCAVVLGDENGSILEKVRFDTVGVNETLARILDEVALMHEKNPDAVSVGISCGGPLDPVRGIIQSPPNLPGWDNIEIVRMIKERTGLSAMLCNDANACALAEYKFGAGAVHKKDHGVDNLVFLTFGTGLGAGIIIGGKLYNGANGNAGEIGHVRLRDFGPVGYGKQGSVEGFASGGGIAMMAKTAAIERLQQGKTCAYCKSFDELDNVTAKSVAMAADAGDETAKKVYALSGEMLGYGLSILVDVLNPDLIVIGSIYQRSSHLLRGSMNAVLEKECLPISLDAVRVVPAELGDNLGDIAAISLAIAAEEEGIKA